jgi:hypothetical protein
MLYEFEREIGIFVDLGVEDGVFVAIWPFCW